MQKKKSGTRTNDFTCKSTYCLHKIACTLFEKSLNYRVTYVYFQTIHLQRRVWIALLHTEQGIWTTTKYPCFHLDLLLLSLYTTARARGWTRESTERGSVWKKIGTDLFKRQWTSTMNSSHPQITSEWSLHHSITLWFAWPTHLQITFTFIHEK